MASATGAGLRVAIDVGGTFTDIVIVGGAAGVFTYKILNQPEQLGAQIDGCIQDALGHAARRGETARVGAIAFGTTKCSNTVLERTGAKTGLLCTEGFRDILEFRDGARPPVHHIFWERTPPLVPRHRRLEVVERALASGEIKTPLGVDSAQRAVRSLTDQGVEAIAIAFLHAYRNPLHEKIVLDIVRAEAPGVQVCASHEVLPEIREYPRTSTTVVNAYLMKIASEYLGEIEGALAQYQRPLLIMQSNGGIMTSALARRQPIRMLESGPAAGVLAAAQLAQELTLSKAVAFDMGGTTVKACLIENGVAAQSQDCEVGTTATTSNGKGAGYTVRVPGFDIVEIGAGGGSIARLDRGALLRVGPDSAGSAPGPACYGRGGERPTVTDANVVLGYMNPEAIAGGAVPIDLAAARGVIARDLAEPLGLTVEAAAHGVHKVANSTMARAVRAVTSERGRDPRDYTLIAFGGGGPIHAAALAEEIGMREAIVPLYPGLFSAVGLQFADQLYDRVRSVLIPLQADRQGEIARTCEDVTRELMAELSEMDIGGEGHVAYDYFADLSQTQHMQDLTLQLPDLGDVRLSERLAEEFHREHETNYGYRRDREPIFITNVRVKASISAYSTSPRELLKANLRAGGGEGAVRSAYFGPERGAMDARVLARFDLADGPAPGPAIIEEFDTTVVVPPGWSASLDALANIVLRQT